MRGVNYNHHCWCEDPFALYPVLGAKSDPPLVKIDKFSISRFGAVGSDVGQISEVTLRQARLVLGWVTVSRFNSQCGKFISV